jgi:hypothetical protein
MPCQSLHASRIAARRRGRSLTQNRRSQYSHPVTSALIISADTSFNHSTTLSDCTGLPLLRSVLRGGCSSTCSSVSTTPLFLILFPSWLVAGRSSNRLSILLILVDGPVEDVVVLERFSDEEITKDLAEVGIVGLIVEAEGSGVVEIDGELVGEAAAEDFGGGGHLLLHDTIVLLLLGSGLQTLPWEGASAEVEHDIAERLHVVTTGLLDTEMSVDGGITSSASQVLVLTVRDVEVSLRVTVFLGKTKVDHVDLVTPLSDAHEEVVGLDVTVDEGLGVDVLDAGDELIGEEEDGLEGELAVAEVEEVFQAGAEEVEDHGVVVTLGAEPANEGNADASSEGLVDTGLILELGVLGLDGFEFDGNLFTGDDVGS